MNLEASSSGRAAWLLLGAGLLIGLALGLVVFYGLPALPLGRDASAPAAGGGLPGKPAPAPVVGAPAPDFTLKDLDGNSVSLSSEKGKVVLINFWATWCGPCRLEMPAIEQRYEAYKDQGFVVLAVDFDEPVTDVGAFAHAYNLTFPVLLDPGAKVNDLYRIIGYPTTFFVDREGIITRQHVGAMTEAQLDNYLADFGLSGGL